MFKLDRFMDADYRGMYNMPLAQLTEHKGLKNGENLLDRMERSELAASHFRVTQTEEKLRADRVIDQQTAEEAARQVGAVVYEAMFQASGTLPESLPVHEDISMIRQGLRATDKAFKKYDRTTTKGKRMLDTLPESNDPPDPGYTQDPDEERVNRTC